MWNWNTNILLGSQLTPNRRLFRIWEHHFCFLRSEHRSIRFLSRHFLGNQTLKTEATKKKKKTFIYPSIYLSIYIYIYRWRALTQKCRGNAKGAEEGGLACADGILCEWLVDRGLKFCPESWNAKREEY